MHLGKGDEVEKIVLAPLWCGNLINLKNKVFHNLDFLIPKTNAAKLLTKSVIVNTSIKYFAENVQVIL